MRSPSLPPSPSQPGRSFLALPEAKQCDPPPSRRSNTPSTSVSQPRAASRPAQSPSASTAGSPSLPAGRTSRSRSSWGLGRSRSRGRSPSRSTSKPRPKRARALKTTARSRQNEKERNTLVQPICLSMVLRSFETFGWVLPGTMGWGETSGCATLWGCSMVHRGKNIVNGCKNTQFPPVMKAPCVLCACCAQTPPRCHGKSRGHISPYISME